MQLIVETETTLDIEINMSSVENIHNSKSDELKIVNLDITKFHDKKCNGNKQYSGLIENSKCEETKEVSGSDENFDDTPMTIDNDEAELSKVDLSEIINEKDDILEIKDMETEGSQKVCSETGINIPQSVETEIMNTVKSKETADTKESTLEEDFLEDDIISIVEQPFKEDSVPETEAENVVSERPDILIENDIALGVDKFELEGDKKAPLQSERSSDDVVEVIEETDINPEQCVTNAVLQTPIIESVFDDHVTESHKNIHIPIEKEKHLSMQKEDEDLSIIKEAKESAVQHELAILHVNENEKNEVIDEPNSSCVQKVNEVESIQTKEENKEIGITAEEQLSITCNDSVESPMKESKQDGIEILEEIEKTASVTEERSDEVNIVEEIINHSIQNNSSKDSVIEKYTIDSPLNKNDDVEIIGEEKSSDPDKNKETDSPTEVLVNDNKIEPIENVNTDKTSETSNCDSNVPVSNENRVDTPVVLHNHVMDVEEIAKHAAIAAELSNPTMELQFHMDIEDDVEETKSNNKDDTNVNGSTAVVTNSVNIADKPIICKLSNTLDILSDDDEELPRVDFEKAEPPKVDSHSKESNKCIDLEDDDDLLFIDEDTNKAETKALADSVMNKENVVETDVSTNAETGEKTTQESSDLFESHEKSETTPPLISNKDVNMEINIKDKTPEPTIKNNKPPTPLIPDNFVKTAKKKLADMTRDDLEEFCILKIVESIVDRSSLSEIKNKLKTMTQGLEDHRKKAMMLAKQNRDLQVVLKSVQEEQKKVMGNTPVTPLKITRSVGMQVYMEKTVPQRKKGPQQNINNKNPNNIQNKNMTPPGQGIRPQKQVNQPIPVPRLIPANNPALKTPNTAPQINPMNTTPGKTNNPLNGMLKTPPPPMKAEKRQHSKIASSVTVDLTDDEPPTKMPGGPRTSPAPPVRLVPSQNLMAPQRQAFGTNVNSPRKVYIPISGPQSQALRPGQTIMLKTVPATGIRPRCTTPQVTRVDPNAVRMSRIAPRHPAPLPFAMKQYQPPNWKSLPPAPDLKLSKVENGIVISWKIEGVPEDSYEEIASYQLYAYQETSQPASTTLWKKIGDVKALPLPMACTLTQFMAGFKYYFAVRAVDIRSRLGPFSLPGSILLLSKNM